MKVTAGTATRVQVDVTAEGVARARAREAPYTTALDGSPSDPYFDRGLRQMAVGEFQEAMLTLDPVARRLERSGRNRERARVELYLAVALLELGRAEEARARFARALDLDRSVRLPVSGFSAKAFALFAEVRTAEKERP
jgi:Flp pilus assembly protein TadD